MKTTSLVPIGTVLPFAEATAPVGFLMCDGTAVSRTVVYNNLFSVLGITHGQGDGTTTFHLPDYRGRLLRGVDGAASRDPDKLARTAMATGGNTGNTVGSVQGHATAKNGLALTDPGHSHNQNIAIVGGGTLNPASALGNSSPSSASMSTDSSTTGISLGAGDSETRPINAYVNYIIKY